MVHTLDAILWDEARDEFRAEVLTAMDAAMVRVALEHGRAPSAEEAGAIDADLPVLFKAIDAQFERNMVRYGLWRGED